MKKLKGSSIGRLDNDEKVDDYYKEAALDALLYWTNSTSALAGNNVTMTILTEMLATCIANMVPEKQVDRAREVIFELLNEAFDMVSDDDDVVEKKSELN